jgi:LysM repeat protein
MAAVKNRGRKIDALNLKFISATKMFWFILVLVGEAVFGGFSLQAAAPSNSSRGGSAQSTNNQSVVEVRQSLDTLRHQLNNHESEIRMYDEKLDNLEAIIDSVRDQLNETAKIQKEQLKGSYTTLEEKVASLDATLKGIVSDVRQFKNHAGDATNALVLYKQKIEALENVIEQQNHNIEHLQAAMKAMLEAISPKEASLIKSSAPFVSYQVKAGDSLEKIAKANNTSVKAIKELNGMENDKIVVGKVIKLPQE